MAWREAECNPCFQTQEVEVANRMTGISKICGVNKEPESVRRRPHQTAQNDCQESAKMRRSKMGVQLGVGAIS
jgi:hypothetical protein